MGQAEALDLVRSAIWTVLIAAGPAVGAAMVIGILIALLQALTQVQEVTLTFVPKIIVIFLVSMLTAPFAGNAIFTLTELTYARIEDGFETGP